MSAAQTRESSQQEEAERRGWAKRLVSKAGIEVWLKLFVNMRDSCSDDLERRGIAEKAINSGIGNTARMRHRHYHSVRPSRTGQGRSTRCAMRVNRAQAGGVTEPYHRLTEKPYRVPQWCSKHWLKAGGRKGGGKRRRAS